MKILHLTYWYPTKAQAHKGVFIQKHAHAALKAGCDVHLLNLSIERANCLFKKEMHEWNDEYGMPVTQIIVKSVFYKPLHLMLFLHKKWVQKAFERLHAQNKFNLIHGHVLYPAAIWTAHLAKKHHVPYIISEHWSKIDRFVEKSLFAEEGVRAYNHAIAITSVSAFLKSTIVKHSTNKNITIIGNVINASFFHYLEKSISNNKLVFTAVAHWCAPKRPDLIFKSLQLLAEKHPGKKIELNIVGEGVLLDELKKQNWLFLTTYCGQQPAAVLAKLLGESNYFLHASEVETFSVVIAEALATGTPVLASNRGAIPDLVKPECGIICENTVEAWVEGLEKLISANYSAKRISETTLKFGETEIGNQIKEIYQKAVKPH